MDKNLLTKEELEFVETVESGQFRPNGKIGLQTDALLRILLKGSGISMLDGKGDRSIAMSRGFKQRRFRNKLTKGRL